MRFCLIRRQKDLHSTLFQLFDSLEDDFSLTYLLKILTILLYIHTLYNFNIISNLLSLSVQSAELYPLHPDVMENILNILILTQITFILTSQNFRLAARVFV